MFPGATYRTVTARHALTDEFGEWIARALTTGDELAAASATPETLWVAAAKVDRFAAELDAHRDTLVAELALTAKEAKEAKEVARLALADLDAARRVTDELRRIADHASALHAAGLEGETVARLTRAAVADLLGLVARAARTVTRCRLRRVAPPCRPVTQPHCAHAPPRRPGLDRVTATTSTA